MLKRPAIVCAGLLFAAMLALGVVHLFELRFAQGDVYPPYSTLRTDPLGASVLYESLDEVPGVTTERYFEETFKRDDGSAHALFVLGSKPFDTELSRSEFETLQRFVFNGGRVVIAYIPRVRETWSDREARTNENDDISSEAPKPRRHHKSLESEENGSPTNPPSAATQTNSLPATNWLIANLTITNSASTNSMAARHKSSRHARRHVKSPDDQQKEDGDDEDLKAELAHYADLSTEWGFQLRYENLDTNEDDEVQFPEAKLVAARPGLPELLPIHTALCFTNLTNGWTTIYQRDKKMPVVIERKLGSGSVVLVADSYPFSNEALYKDRNAPLLAWFLGSGRDAIFDEAHLGIAEQPGMATLMRRYQLHGLILSLLLLSGLFVWKNSLSLVPPYAETDGQSGPVVVGRDSASGLVNLARRGIAPADLINVCYAEWKKSNARLAALSPAQRHDLEQLIQQQAALAPQLRKPVENYRVLSQILQRRL